MAKATKGKAALDVGDELVLVVTVVRVDEHEFGDTVTFALSSGQRFTIRQDSSDIAETRKAPKEGRPRGLFDKPD